MNIMEELNEKLRESCCMGDIDGVSKCLAQGASIDSKNKMNGWTSLHWASKRGHTKVVEVLLKANANPSIVNNRDESPFDVANSDSLKQLLSHHLHIHSEENSPFTPIEKPPTLPTQQNSDTDVSPSENKSKFVPNYLKNPAFPYSNQSTKTNRGLDSILQNTEHHDAHQAEEAVELVLKVRHANSNETDFIEIELNKNELTFERLKEICVGELVIGQGLEIRKVRKLPDTIIRKDKDVKRLKQFQEIEILTMDKNKSDPKPRTS